MRTTRSSVPEELAPGRESRSGPHEKRKVPRAYGVPGYHYSVVNNRAVIFHPNTRRTIHAYEPYDDLLNSGRLIRISNRKNMNELTFIVERLFQILFPAI